jgi:hypothetical protein
LAGFHLLTPSALFVSSFAGGMMAQLVFLPMLGSGKLSALSHSCRLLVRCLARLLAAEACKARGYRLLAAGVRAVMQRQPQWRAGLRRRLRRLLRQQQQQQGELEAGAGAAGVVQQQQQ